MWLVLHHYFKLERAETTGSVVRHVVAVLDAQGLGDAPVGFFGRDGYQPKHSMCARLVKARPELADFDIAGLARPGLSNLAPPWILMGRGDLPDQPVQTLASGRQLGREAMFEIADGVPKRFALHESHFMFGPLAPLQIGATAPVPRLNTIRPVDVDAPYVIVDSSWGTPRRDIVLGATVIMDAPARAAKKVPPLPPKTEALLQGLAKIGKAKVTQELFGSDEDHAGLRDKWTRSNAVGDAFVARIDPAALPNALGRPGGWEQQHGSLKEPVAERLKPLGYKSRPGVMGILNFTRRTAADNVVLVKIDRTPIAAELRVTITMHGPLWTAYASQLPVSNVPNHDQVHTEEECVAAADNILWLVRRFEAEVMSEIDAIQGPGARWFEPKP